MLLIETISGLNMWWSVVDFKEKRKPAYIGDVQAL